MSSYCSSFSESCSFGYGYGNRYSTALKPAFAAASKRSRKSTSLKSIVRLAASFGMVIALSCFGDKRDEQWPFCGTRFPLPQGARGLALEFSSLRFRLELPIQRNRRGRVGGDVLDQSLELGDVVDLRAHGDIGDTLQDDLHHHWHPVLFQPFLRLLERR